MFKSARRQSPTIINMDTMKLSIAAIVLSLLLATFGTAQSAVLDIKTFGGAPNADITQVRNIHI